MSAVLAVAVVGAGIVLAAQAVSTSSARISASTGTRGLFEAGVVVLARPDSSASYAFDDNGLYPGHTIRECIELRYDGSVPATIRLHVANEGGSGLDEFVDVQFRVLLDATCVDGVIVGEVGPDVEVFDGRLRALSTEHSSFATGVWIADPNSDDSLVLEAMVTVVDDNRAQGLTTEFTFTFEARPA